MRSIAIVLPAERGEASHVVIANGQGYLFTTYNDAKGFEDLLTDQLAYNREAVIVYPLAPVPATSFGRAASERSL